MVLLADILEAYDGLGEADNLEAYDSLDAAGNHKLVAAHGAHKGLDYGQAVHGIPLDRKLAGERNHLDMPLAADTPLAEDMLLASGS